ncbi:MAG: hypothetical protein AAGH15_02490 [Myxococcota bacterium]
MLVIPSALRTVLMPLLLTLLALGCGEDEIPICDTPEQAEACLRASCAGRVVNNCLPYEYAIVREAEWAPDRIPVDDPGTPFRYRIVLDRCEEAPTAHEVRLEIVEPGAAVIDLLRSPIRIDEDRPDDPAGAPQARVVRKIAEAEIGNPFIGPEIPESDAFELRVSARAGAQIFDAGVVGGTCASPPLSTTFRTGPRPLGL